MNPAGKGPVLRGRGLAKHFGGIFALQEVDLELYAGEVHVLLGANGAGKSTLVKLLAGNLVPDQGTLYLQDREVRFDSPRAALAHGIATVYQELSLFPGLTVAQNILIGREPRNRLGWLREGAVRVQARQILAELGETSIRPDTKVADLSLAERQLVEIAKALSHAPPVLVLDEPTSSLSKVEVDRLTDVIQALRTRGTAIVFISHRLEEIEQLGDRVTVLRSGRKVGEFSREAFDRSAALELMLGEQWHEETTVPTAGLTETGSSGPLLSVVGLSVMRVLHDIDLSLRPGEVVGLAGLEGHGQKALLMALFGIYRRGVSGTIELQGRRLRLRTPRRAIRGSIAFVPDDRKTMGGILPLSVAENISITIVDRLFRWFRIDPKRERERVRHFIDALKIKCRTSRVPLWSLSGGNQQKVVAAKWLALEQQVYLFCDPTRGVDAGARQSFYELIRSLASAGKGVLVYSSDIGEFRRVCSRVLVLREGRIVGTLQAADISERNIMDLSFGAASTARHLQ